MDDKKSSNNDLAKVLEKQIGFQIQRYGGEGSYSLIRLRGSNANQVNVYLEGIPLNFASYNEVNLSDLHLHNIERIDIQKNGSLTGIPGSSIGGSINLITGIDSPKENYVFIQGGSYKTFGVGFFYNQFYKDSLISTDNSQLEKKYKAGWNISAYRETSDQDYSFINHNGTLYFNRWDDFKDKRENSQYKKNSGMISGFYKFGDTTIKILNDSLYRNHGIPGPITRKTEKTKREHFRNTSGILTDTKNFFFDTTRLKTRFYYTYLQNHFKDPKNELAFGANSSKANLHNKGFHFMPEVILNDYYQRIHFLVGYEEERYTEDKFTSYNFKTEDLPEKKRYHRSYHISDEIYLYKDLVTFQPEFRYEEYYNNFFIETQRKKIILSESLNKDESRLSFRNDSYLLTIFFIKDKYKKLKTNFRYSSEKRIPAFIELFGEKGAIVPNLKLRPEQSYNREIGISFILIDFIFDLKFYSRTVRDLILFVPNSQFSLRAENIENADFKGWESSIKYLFKDIFQISLGYHYQEAIRIDRNQYFYEKKSYLPLLPMLTFKGMFILFPEGKFEFSIDVQYQGAMFASNSNDYFSYREPKWFWNTSLYYRPIEKLMLYIEVRNLENKLYEDIIGYPLPGRNYLAGIKYFF